MERLDALIDRIECGDTAAIAAALRADPTLVSARSRDGDTLLHIACWQKQAAIIQVLLEHGPDLDARGDGGWTALHYAVREGGPETPAIVGALLARGADPTLLDERGLSIEALAEIEMFESLDEVRALLRAPRDTRAAVIAFEDAAAREAREPVELDVSVRFGGPSAPTCELRAYCGRSLTTGERAAELVLNLSAATPDGGSISISRYPPIASDELEHFRASLAEIAATGVGHAVLEGLEPLGIMLEVRGDARGVRARPVGRRGLPSPNALDEPIEVTHSLDRATLEEIIARLADARDGLAAWKRAARA